MGFTVIRRHFISLRWQSNCFALLNMTDLHKNNKCLNTWKLFFFLKGKLLNGKMHDRKRMGDQGDVRTGDIINSITVLFTAQLHNINVIVTLVI